MSTVAEALDYAIHGAGKKLRPALLCASYEAVAGRTAPAAVAELGEAVELIHTYSLVHDDLPCMDDDAVRRGRATTHVLFGERTAMLAGIAMIPLAFRKADDAARQLGVKDEARKRIARVLARGAGANGMVGGQVMDIESGSHDVDLNTLEQIHAWKTGALLRASCMVGAIAAHADEAQLAAIAEYGAHIGLAFQITDDILDETASSQALGKTAGKDREGGKATFTALLGLDGAAARARQELTAALEALRTAGLHAERLEQLARFAVERKR